MMASGRGKAGYICTQGRPGAKMHHRIHTYTYIYIYMEIPCQLYDYVGFLHSPTIVRRTVKIEFYVIGTSAI